VPHLASPPPPPASLQGHGYSKKHAYGEKLGPTGHACGTFEITPDGDLIGTGRVSGIPGISQISSASRRGKYVPPRLRTRPSAVSMVSHTPSQDSDVTRKKDSMQHPSIDSYRSKHPITSNNPALSQTSPGKERKVLVDLTRMRQQSDIEADLTSDQLPVRQSSSQDMNQLFSNVAVPQASPVKTTLRPSENKPLKKVDKSASQSAPQIPSVISIDHQKGSVAMWSRTAAQAKAACKGP